MFQSNSKRSPRQARPSLESFEPRNLLSAGPTLLPATGRLLIEGTSAADTVTVRAPAGQVQVEFDGRTFSFPSRSVRDIVFAGLAGDDVFVNRTGVRSILNGGAGDDRLTGGSGDDVILGGAGNDDLVGGAGHDLLDGGAGNDRSDRDRSDTVRGVERVELAAALAGVAGATGSSEFKLGPAVRRNFEAEVSGLAANQSFDVLLDGKLIGSLRTNALGHGELKLNDPLLPVKVGSVLKVRDAQGQVVLSGTFANAQAGDDAGAMRREAQPGDDHGRGGHGRDG